MIYYTNDKIAIFQSELNHLSPSYFGIPIYMEFLLIKKYFTGCDCQTPAKT